jgi:hypothetical protein
MKESAGLRRQVGFKGGAEVGEEKRGEKGLEREEKAKPMVSTLSAPLGQAMLPVFRYLRMLFDPIYSVLEQATSTSIKRAILPHLLLLLHLCNEMNVSSPTAQRFEFGLYHLKNVPDSLIQFLTEQLNETGQHVSELKTDAERAIFQQQLFQLPKVRLRSLIKNKGGIPTMTNALQSIFHLQFFVVGQNLLIPDEESFKKKNPKVDSKVLQVMRETLLPQSVFLSYTDASTTTENLPFRFFEIDYETVMVNQPGITVTPFSADLDALQTDGFLPSDGAYLDQLAGLKPYHVFNDAELALSVLMCLKERMPK